MIRKAESIHNISIALISKLKNLSKKIQSLYVENNCNRDTSLQEAGPLRRKPLLSYV